MTATTTTAADGTFTLTGVQPGKYVLHASRKLPELGELYLEVIDDNVGPVVVRIGPRR